MYDQNPNIFVVQYKPLLTFSAAVQKFWSIESECKKHQWSCTGFSEMQELYCSAFKHCIALSFTIEKRTPPNGIVACEQYKRS